MRNIPSVMFSQHPDHARKPYWHTSEFINTRDETEECFLSFSEFGADECKWDWEGKFVDEAVVERLFGNYFSFFKKFPLGKEKFLTFRIPNPKVDTDFRLGRALMIIASSSALAKKIGLHSPPLFEAILPMTQNAQEIFAISQAFDELSKLKHPIYRHESLHQLEVIPLFEETDIIVNSDIILKKYLELYKKKYRNYPQYLRPYLARSDPALCSGLVATVLSIKIALSRYKKFEKNYGVLLFPIIGAGALPFRGNLKPNRISQFMEEYRGVRTILTQSAFRYDFHKTMVVQSVQQLKKNIGKKQALELFGDEEKEIYIIIKKFEDFYHRDIETIGHLISHISTSLPQRRERLSHFGMFGYSRKAGNIKLPRAISFTATLYSIGIPPELIGTGRGLHKIFQGGDTPLLEKYYTYLKDDLLIAGRFLNKKNLHQLAQNSSLWNGILDDVEKIEKYLGETLHPVTDEEKEHQLITTNIFRSLSSNYLPESLVNKAAILRNSVG